MYGRVGHIVHVTTIPRANFCWPFPWRLHKIFGFDYQAVSEQKMFEHYYINSVVNLNPWCARSRNQIQRRARRKTNLHIFRSRCLAAQDKNHKTIYKTVVGNSWS